MGGVQRAAYSSGADRLPLLTDRLTELEAEKDTLQEHSEHLKLEGLDLEKTCMCRSYCSRL